MDEGELAVNRRKSLLFMFTPRSKRSLADIILELNTRQSFARTKVSVRRENVFSDAVRYLKKSFRPESAMRVMARTKVRKHC